MLIYQPIQNGVAIPPTSEEVGFLATGDREDLIIAALSTFRTGGNQPICEDMPIPNASPYMQRKCQKV